MKNKHTKLTVLGLAILAFATFPRTLHSYEEIVVKDGATIRGLDTTWALTLWRTP